MANVKEKVKNATKKVNVKKVAGIAGGIGALVATVGFVAYKLLGKSEDDYEETETLENEDYEEAEDENNEVSIEETVE